MIRNIIFDWSGTLMDDLPAVLKATNHVLRQAGLEEFSLDRFRAEFCLPFKKFYDRFTPQIPMAQLETWFHDNFKQAQSSISEIPHAREFLQACQKRGVRMFVLSTVHPDHFAPQLALTGFGTYFEHAYVGVHDKEEKIRSILAENTLASAETLLVGDMQHDIDAAKHGGIKSCAVLTGYTGLEQLRESEPDLIVEHLGELQKILEEQEWNLTSGPQKPIATVGALIFNSSNEVLMIRTHKWSGLWGIPGGKIRFGEPSVDALRRELKEETNLAVSDIRFVMVQDCIHSREFYRDAHFILLNYTCRSSGNLSVKLNEEAREFRWVTLEAARQMALNEPTRVLLDAVAGKIPQL